MSQLRIAECGLRNRNPRNSGKTKRPKPMMKNLYVIILIMFASVAVAQDGATDRDPFASPAKRLPAPSSAPAGNAWGRDPFNNPLAGRAPARRERVPDARGKGLTGVIYSADIRLAIINGEVLREGSSIGDGKVASIGERSVSVVNAAGATEEIPLKDFSMRK